MDSFVRLVRAFHERGVRFVVIGVWGANYYATGGATLFTTQDRDLFLAPDADSLLQAWQACETSGLGLWAGDEPLDTPRDARLAAQVAARGAAVRVSDGSGLEVDLSTVMAGLDFETVWEERRIFRVDDVEVPVARLSHIVASKAAAGREKDRLFLATHAEALRQLLARDGPPEGD